MRPPAGEDELLAWLAAEGGDTTRAIGDDAAILPGEGPFVVTLDAQVEGTHFPPGRPPGEVARRLVAVNLSDLAAMGAEPSHAFLSLGAPTDYDRRGFLAAIVAAAREHGFQLAGGDLSRQERVSAVLVLHGTKPTSGRFLRRDAARPGDALWVGGPLGLAAAGLCLSETTGGRDLAQLSVEVRDVAREARSRQRLPRPQLALGHWLGERPRAAAIDVSDGLARDLHRLARASGVGAVVEWERLPIDPALPRLADELEIPLRDWVLTGGEDYVLLFTLPEGEEPPTELGARQIGSIVAGGDVVLIEDGRSVLLPPGGWDHLTSP